MRNRVERLKNKLAIGIKKEQEPMASALLYILMVFQNHQKVSYLN
jgi:hypothetical protein